MLINAKQSAGRPERISKATWFANLGPFNIDTTLIESGGRNAVEGVASSIHTSATEAIYKATSAASSMVEAQVHEFKSHLPQYYLIGP
jgi:hypothetical protein